jgi:hypothetical protein
MLWSVAAIFFGIIFLKFSGFFTENQSSIGSKILHYIYILIIIIGFFRVLWSVYKML